MDEFNLLVLHIATIVLIIALIVVGIILYYSLRSGKFPPFDTACPSFYQLDPSGNSCIYMAETYPNTSSQNKYPTKAISNNNINAGVCNKVSVSQFNKSGTTSDDILCEKNKWANGCSIYWDGVTNNPNACIKKRNNLFMN